MQVCRNAWPLSCLVWAGNVHWENPSPPAFPEGLHTWDLAKEQSREKRGKWDENDDIVLKTFPERGEWGPSCCQGDVEVFGHRRENSGPKEGVCALNSFRFSSRSVQRFPSMKKRDESRKRRFFCRDEHELHPGESAESR